MPLLLKTPLLRFPGYDEDWKLQRMDQLVSRVSKPVQVQRLHLYQQIGIRSHGKGIFHKDPVSGTELGNKRVFWVKENLLLFNIVFAWEQAVARSTHSEVGMVASHRFPMFKPRDGVADLDFLWATFLTTKGKYLLEIASPGGAGRNKTLGQKEFDKLKLCVPCLPEQQKVGNFITAITSRLEQLERSKELLENFRRGLIQDVFNGRRRLTKRDGSAFPDWEEMRLNEILKERKTRNTEGNVTEVFSVAKNKGIVNQLEHLGRSYASEDLSNYKIVKPNDLVYTKSPTGEFPYGIIKQNKLDRTGIVSVLYAVYQPAHENYAALLNYFFSIWTSTFNYLNPLVHKGAKNTMNIGNSEFLNGAKIRLPVSEDEQLSIINLFRTVDERVQLAEQQISKTKAFRSGILQQMLP